MGRNSLDWVPTAKAKECARALGIDITEWPDWLRRTYERNSLREIKTLLLGHRVRVSYTWLSDQLREFDIPTSKRPARQATG